jgi:hypothetical protein
MRWGSATPRLFGWGGMGMPIILIPFSIFFIFCASQFFFIHRVRRLLVERHPEVWNDMSKRAWFVDNAVAKFIWGRKDRRLNDPKLSKIVRQGALFYYFGLFIWVIYAGLLITGSGFAQISFGQLSAWVEVFTSSFVK